MTLSRIEINADGRQIIVDHDGGDLAYVVDKAEKLWRDTQTPDKPAGPAFGFQAERRWTGDTTPTGNGYGRRSADPITAQEA